VSLYAESLCPAQYLNVDIDRSKYQPGTLTLPGDGGLTGVYISSTSGCTQWGGTLTWGDVPSWSIQIDVSCTQSGLADAGIAVSGTMSGTI